MLYMVRRILLTRLFQAYWTDKGEQEEEAGGRWNEKELLHQEQQAAFLHTSDTEDK